MNLDVRLPIGLMFTIFGVLLTGFGWLGDPKSYQEHPLKLNINLYWGVVLLAFGVLMLLLVARGRKQG